jgi:hypothetical protein
VNYQHKNDLIAQMQAQVNQSLLVAAADQYLKSLNVAIEVQ